MNRRMNAALVAGFAAALVATHAEAASQKLGCAPKNETTTAPVAGPVKVTWTYVVTNPRNSVVPDKVNGPGTLHAGKTIPKGAKITVTGTRTKAGPDATVYAGPVSKTFTAGSAIDPGASVSFPRAEALDGPCKATAAW